MAGADASADGLSYQATYRRGPYAIIALLLIMAGLCVGVWASFAWINDGNASLDAALRVIAVAVAGVVLVMLTAFRVHRWTIGPDGLTIVERPKVPLTGLKSTTRLGFAEIAGLREMESGFDTMIQLEARGGRTFLLPQAYAGQGQPRPLHVADFGNHVCAACVAAGAPVPASGPALSFWNSALGLIVIALMMVPALPIGVLAVMAMLDGGVRTTNPNTSKAAGIAIVLPLGVAWLFWKSWRRRRRVLATRT